MELWLLLLVCGVGVVCAGKEAYFYPPVYGHFKDAEHTPSKTHKDTNTKAGRYYYPPVYGTANKPEYSPATSYQEKEKSSSYKRRIPRDRKYQEDHREDRNRKYQEDRREERDQYYKQQPETKYKVREERTYVRPAETKRRTHYKHPETERRTYYKAPQTEKRSYYKAPEKKSYSKKTQKCYQCEYSAPKPIKYEVLVTEPYDIKVPRTVQECEWERTIEYVYQEPKRGSRQMYGQYKEVPKYEKHCHPKTVFDTKTKYRSRYVKKQRIGSSGGFEACKGPLDAYKAKKSGVDDWDCHNNCYVKKDKSGTITRGCYSGQYKVDPDRLGCHYQGDNKHDMYCFCKGDHCNGGGVPAPASSLSYDF